MPTFLGNPQSTLWRGNPPHMLREDIPVWLKFINKYYSQFEAIYYDVLVGGPFLSPEEEKDPLKWMWRYNNSKRLDAVAKLKDEVWLIEVVTHTGIRSLGQLMTYMALWQDDDPLGLIERPVLLTSIVDQDIIYSASKYGIQTIVI